MFDLHCVFAMVTSYIPLICYLAITGLNRLAESVPTNVGRLVSSGGSGMCSTTPTRVWHAVDRQAFLLFLILGRAGPPQYESCQLIVELDGLGNVFPFHRRSRLVFGGCS
jgi:hypothetical protein